MSMEKVMEQTAQDQLPGLNEMPVENVSNDTSISYTQNSIEKREPIMQNEVVEKVIPLVVFKHLDQLRDEASIAARKEV